MCIFLKEFEPFSYNIPIRFIQISQLETISCILFTSNIFASTISKNPGYFRLYAKPNVIENRKQFSFTGFRQKESDFEYEVKMEFSPTDEEVECGIIHYQKEYNYLSSTVYKNNRNYHLSLKLAEKNKNPTSLKKIRLNNYKDQIIFKVVSINDEYDFLYSLDNGNSFESYSKTKAEVVLDRNYTGAYLGMYATSNGRKSSDFADFDWVRYKGFSR